MGSCPNQVTAPQGNLAEGFLANRQEQCSLEGCAQSRAAHRSSPPVLSRSDREKMAERGKSSASSVAMKLVTLLLMQITSLVALRSLGSSQTCDQHSSFLE